MDTRVKSQLVLNRKSKSSRFSSFTGNANGFLDKMLRVLFITLLVTIDFVIFLYSLNGRLFENGNINQAILFLSEVVFGVAFVVIFLLSFSKSLQNLICALITMVITVIFYNQFALFDVNNFLEKWCDQHLSWLSVFCFFSSAWMVGFFLGVIIFFGFRSRFFMVFMVLVLLLSSVLGIKNKENVPVIAEGYTEVKHMGGNVGGQGVDRIVYFMLPKFASYQLYGGMNNVYMKELRDLLVGFYATNGFEVYPNAFVQDSDASYNVIDIFNQTDYTSTTSVNRGYSDYINDWEFIKGELEYTSLEENRLYKFLNENKIGTSIYAMPNFNLCLVGGKMTADRCVVKNFKDVEIYEREKTLQQNVSAFLGYWLLSIKDNDLKTLAKSFLKEAGLDKRKVIFENRRISIEGAQHIFAKVAEDFWKDKGSQAYLVYVDMPSDEYIYDEYCNVKPRDQWISLKDNSLIRGGIDEKRLAYVEQTKCMIGRMQEFMDNIYQSPYLRTTNIIIQGISPARELGEMVAGQYGNFVKDKLVNLAIRKGKNPKFLINANVCLASDFSRTLMRYQDYCYTLDNMKMGKEDRYSLKKNLINNSIIRGNKISNITALFRDWYIEFKERSKKDNIKINKKDDKQEVQTQNKPVREQEIQISPSLDLILEYDEYGELKDDNLSFEMKNERPLSAVIEDEEKAYNDKKQEVQETQAQEPEVEGEGVQVEAEGVQAEVGNTKAEDESVQAEDDSTKVEIESTQVEDESVQAGGESVQVEAEVAKVEVESAKSEVENEGAKVEVEGIQVEDEGVQAKADGAQVEDESVQAEELPDIEDIFEVSDL